MQMADRPWAVFRDGQQHSDSFCLSPGLASQFSGRSYAASPPAAAAWKAAGSADVHCRHRSCCSLVCPVNEKKLKRACKKPTDTRTVGFYRLFDSSFQLSHTRS